jgi:hypothetical protein
MFLAEPSFATLTTIHTLLRVIIISNATLDTRINSRVSFSFYNSFLLFMSLFLVIIEDLKLVSFFDPI